MNKIIVYLITLFMFTAISYADDAGSVLTDNIGGLNVLIANGTPNVIQIISNNTSVDSTFAINFPGNRVGRLFTITAINEGAIPDTLVKYYFTSTTKTSEDKVRGDSTKLVIDPVSERVLNFFASEGDTLRWVHAAGKGRLEIGGVKNMRGMILSDYQ